MLLPPYVGDNLNNFQLYIFIYALFYIYTQKMYIKHSERHARTQTSRFFIRAPLVLLLVFFWLRLQFLAGFILELLFLHGGIGVRSLLRI